MAGIKLERNNMAKTLLEIYMEDSSRPYSLEQAKTARDEGMKKGKQSINPWWREHALDAMFECAANNRELIVDDVWQYFYDAVGKRDAHTHDNRVMGSVIAEAKKYRWLKPTDRYKPSSRTTSHANPRRVWESLIYRQTEYQQREMEL
jgi:hypothetical protein